MPFEISEVTGFQVKKKHAIAFEKMFRDTFVKEDMFTFKRLRVQSHSEQNYCLLGSFSSFEDLRNLPPCK